MVVQSRWKKRILASLALAGLTCGTMSSTAPPRAAASDGGERIVTVQDLGKPGQKCRVLRAWRMPDGGSAYEVQALETGEFMTVVENGPPTTMPGPRPGTRVQMRATRIYHWGRHDSPPPGAPIPPGVVEDHTASRKVAPAENPVKTVAARSTNKEAPPRPSSSPTTTRTMPYLEDDPPPPPPARAVEIAPVSAPPPLSPLPPLEPLQPIPVPPRTWEPAREPAAALPGEAKPSVPGALVPEISLPSAPPGQAVVIPIAPPPVPLPVLHPVDLGPPPVVAPQPQQAVQAALPPVVIPQPAPIAVPPPMPVAPPVQQEPPPVSVPAPRAVEAPKVYTPAPMDIPPAPVRIQPVTIRRIGEPPAVQPTPEVPPPPPPPRIETPPPLPQVEVPAPPPPPPPKVEPPAPPVVPPMPESPPVEPTHTESPYLPPPSVPEPQPAVVKPALPPSIVLPQEPRKAENSEPSPPVSVEPTPPVVAPPPPPVAPPAPEPKVEPVLPQVTEIDAKALEEQLGQLRDGLLPSDRERAIDKLTGADLRKHPQVAQALVTAARTDPAATVRVSCLRALVKQGVTTVPVMFAVQELRKDKDIRVSSEAEWALRQLQGGK